MCIINQNRLSSVQLWTHTTLNPRVLPSRLKSSQGEKTACNHCNKDGMALIHCETRVLNNRNKTTKKNAIMHISVLYHYTLPQKPPQKKMTFPLYNGALVAGNLPPNLLPTKGRSIRDSKAVALPFHSPQVDLHGRHQPWTGHYLQYFP